MGIETALLIGTAASVAAAGVSAVSQYQQAQSQSAADQYNEAALKQQARVALQQSAAAEDQQRQASREALNRQVAGASEGAVETSGSRADLLAQNAGDAEYDALLTRYKGKLQASGLTGQAAQAKAQAAASSRFGTQALVGGLIGAGAQGLSGYATALRYRGGGGYGNTNTKDEG